MSSGHEYSLEFAKSEADKCLAAVAAFCESALVVGSVRRLRPVVHDVELLIVPRTQAQAGLFGPTGATESLFELAFSKIVEELAAHVQTAGPARKRIVLPSGLPVDIFISDAERVGVETVIVTGPAAFSKMAVTRRQRGGWLPSDCVITNGWRVYRGAVWVPMPTEEAFLDFLGLGWIPPEDRK